MSNFSIEHIGALELTGAFNIPSDGALEATVHAGPQPTSQCGSFGPFTSCPRIDANGALEAEAANPTFTTPLTGCRVVDDGALEEAAAATSGPTMGVCSLHPGYVGCISDDDGTLEASVGPVTPTGGAWTQFCCRRVDDSALEASVHAGPAFTRIRPGCIDDGVLEATATMGPGSTMTAAHPFTYCPRIDDAT